MLVVVVVLFVVHSAASKKKSALFFVVCVFKKCLHPSVNIRNVWFVCAWFVVKISPSKLLLCLLLCLLLEDRASPPFFSKIFLFF